MARTVVGLFPNQEAAQHVKKHLIGEGYAADNLRVVANTVRTHSAGSATTGEQNDDTGFVDTISNFFRSFTGSDPDDEKHYTEGVSTGGALLTAVVPDDHADTVAELMERHGAHNVDEQKVEKGGVTGKTTPASEGVQKLNVVEEDLQVGKRQVQRGGVRVYSHVTERPVQEDITLREEHIRVDRRPVDRAATDADFATFKEGTIELTESAEEAVVSKRARVVEEVTIGKTVSERQQTIKDTVRHTDVKIEKIGSESLEPKFRKHFESNYAKGGAKYDTYAPAYGYGHTLGDDPRYKQKDWNDVEAAAKSDWANHGTGTWDDMKAAVRNGWDEVRGAAKR